MLIESLSCGVGETAFAVSRQAKATAAKAINIAVTGAGGQIGYSLLFRLATGELLGLRPAIFFATTHAQSKEAKWCSDGIG